MEWGLIPYPLSNMIDDLAGKLAISVERVKPTTKNATIWVLLVEKLVNMVIWYDFF
jgi:hypothetical protein